MMSYVSRIEVVQNDYGYDLEFQLTDASGNPVDLSGATSTKIFVAEKDATTAKVVGTCVVTDAVNGLFKYTVQDGDFDVGNKDYQVEVEITYPTKVVSGKGAIISVLPELPETKG
jgi:hypothetical protein